jgi:hypothetical protein
MLHDVAARVDEAPREVGLFVRRARRLVLRTTKHRRKQTQSPTLGNVAEAHRLTMPF